MKKLFLKLFASIFAITVIALVIQNGLLILNYDQSQKEWKEVVYTDFVNNFEKSLAESSFPDFSVDSIKLFSEALADSRVSGFIVKDQDGRIAFTVGQTAGGEILASIIPQHTKLDDLGKKVTTKSHNTILNLRYNRGVTTIERIDEPDISTTYFIPSAINANDVLGSITVMFESQNLSSVDILSYSPRTYKYSKDVINNCIHGIAISVPICLLFALICALIISSSNTKYINGIRKALNELSQGKNNVVLKSNRNSSLNEITTAVHELDKNLQANKKSRQAWLTSISHDLNTPATAIKMIVDGMVDGVFKPNKNNLADLQNESNVLCERINKVIDFSSLQADVKPVVSEVKCTDLIALPVQVKTDFKVETVKCDKVLMTKAVSEMIKNACACTEEDKISISISYSDKTYSITVCNPGQLPSDKDADSLFEPWAKGDKSRGTSGNGLGLPIVASIAKIHNGKASIEQKNNLIFTTITWTVK